MPMLKVAFWVFGLLKLTKYELVLVCFNTPFNTMKLLTALLSTAIALAPMAGFASPIKFAKGSYCGSVVSDTSYGQTHRHTVNLQPNQYVEVIVEDGVENNAITTVKSVTGKPVKLQYRRAYDEGTAGFHLYTFRTAHKGNYTIQQVNVGQNSYVGFTVCAK